MLAGPRYRPTAHPVLKAFVEYSLSLLISILWQKYYRQTHHKYSKLIIIDKDAEKDFASTNNSCLFQRAESDKPDRFNQHF